MIYILSTLGSLIFIHSYLKIYKEDLVNKYLNLFIDHCKHVEQSNIEDLKKTVCQIFIFFIVCLFLLTLLIKNIGGESHPDYLNLVITYSSIFLILFLGYNNKEEYQNKNKKALKSLIKMSSIVLIIYTLVMYLIWHFTQTSFSDIIVLTVKLVIAMSLIISIPFILGTFIPYQTLKIATILYKKLIAKCYKTKPNDPLSIMIFFIGLISYTVSKATFLIDLITYS